MPSTISATAHENFGMTSRASRVSPSFSHRTGASRCYAAVVRDGVRIYPFGGAKPPDLDKIFAEELAGIELYARSATVPAELRDAATCGALVLWTRDGAR